VPRGAKKKPDWKVPRQVDVAEFCGVSLATVQSWAKQDMPGTPGAYDVREIVQWLRSWGPWRQHAKPDGWDPLVDEDAGDGSSPAQERYRAAKAAIAELQLEQLKGTLLSREAVRGALGRWATLIRRMGERLGKRFGPDAIAAVNEALNECQYVVDHDVGGDNSGGDESAGDSAEG